MASHSRVRAQGALEYLLLIGGVVLLATIVLVMLLGGVLPQANSVVQNAIVSSNQQLLNQSPLPLQFSPLVPVASSTVLLGSAPNELSLSYSSNQLQLQSLVAASSKYNVSTPQIWKLELRSASNSSIMRDSQSVNVPVLTAQAIQGNTTHTQFVWENIPLQGSDVARVIVTISNASNSPDFFWRLRYELPSSYKAERVHFPVFVISPAGATSHHAVLPTFGGQLVTNPFFTYSQTLRHPGPLLQFISIFDAVSKDGVYWSTLDGQGYTKDYLVDSFPASINWDHVFHVPSNAPAAYDLPYPTVLSPIQGGWFASARKYRSWALTQPKLVGRGKWALSNTISPRIKQADLMILQSPANENFDQHHIFADEIIAASNFFNTENILIYWYRWHQNLFDDNWPEHDPKSTFVAAMAQVAATKPGITLLPYFFAGGWDITISSGAYAYVPGLVSRMCQDPVGVGKIAYLSGTGAQYVFFDYTQAINRVLQEGVVSDILGYGADGVYFDYFSGLVAELCYNDPATTGHPSGGGAYWTDGKRAMLHDMKQHGQSIKPHFVSLSESVDEFLISELDMMNYYPSFGFDFGVNHPLPIWGVVYHDYILSSSFGNGPLLYNITTPSGAVLARESVTLEFITGKLLNFMNWFADTPFFSNTLTPPNAETVQVMLYSKTLIDSYSFTRPYLLQGEMMPPVPNSYFDDLVVDFLASPPRPQVSAWKRVDVSSNQVGIVLANPRPSVLSYSTLIDLTKYGFSSTQSVSVYRYTSLNPTPQLIGSVVGSYSINESMDPSSVTMLEFR